MTCFVFVRTPCGHGHLGLCTSQVKLSLPLSPWPSFKAVVQDWCTADSSERGASEFESGSERGGRPARSQGCRRGRTGRDRYYPVLLPRSETAAAARGRGRGSAASRPNHMTSTTTIPPQQPATHAAFTATATRSDQRHPLADSETDPLGGRRVRQVVTPRPPHRRPLPPTLGTESVSPSDFVCFYLAR